MIDNDHRPGPMLARDDDHRPGPMDRPDLDSGPGGPRCQSLAGGADRAAAAAGTVTGSGLRLQVVAPAVPRTLTVADPETRRRPPCRAGQEQGWATKAVASWRRDRGQLELEW